jgi:hypothetical protein
MSCYASLKGGGSGNGSYQRSSEVLLLSSSFSILSNLPQQSSSTFWLRFCFTLLSVCSVCKTHISFHFVCGFQLQIEQKWRFNSCLLKMKKVIENSENCVSFFIASNIWQVWPLIFCWSFQVESGSCQSILFFFNNPKIKWTENNHFFGVEAQVFKSFFF